MTDDAASLRAELEKVKKERDLLAHTLREGMLHLHRTGQQVGWVTRDVLPLIGLEFRPGGTLHRL